MSNYLISIPNTNGPVTGTIHNPKSKLKVRAFDTLRVIAEPKEGEMRFFVTDGEKTITFETEGYKKKHRQLLILQMIAWYCMYLGLLKAKIHTSLPMSA